jgi:hypothetical protein
MKFAILCVALLVGFTSDIAQAQEVVVHGDVKVGEIQSSDPGRECFFFSLAGIQEAHPNFPGEPWLSVPSSSSRAKEILALPGFVWVAGERNRVRGRW